MLGAAENQSPNSVNATSGSDSGGGNASNVVQSSAAVINNDELYNWELQAGGSFNVTRDVEGEQLGCGTKITPFLKENQMEYIDERRINEMQRFKNHKIQEILDAQNAVIDGDMYKKGKGRLNYLLQPTELFAHFAKGSQSASQKKGRERGRHASKLTDEEEVILEVSRRSAPVLRFRGP